MSTPPPAAQHHPAGADGARRWRLREAVNTRPVAYGLVVGVSAAVLVGPARHDPLIILVGSIAVFAIVLGAALMWADRRAEDDLYGTLARDLALTPSGSGSGLLPLTPLLGAGERRRFEHVLTGPIEPGHPEAPRCWLARYAYETVDAGHDGTTVRREHDFHVCAVDLPAAGSRFSGVYVRPRRGVAGALEHDWLEGERTHEVELEAPALAATYELRASADQQDLALRELLSPSLVGWLAEHRLRPGFELRAGTLVVFVPGAEQPAGRLESLRDAAADLARRVERACAQVAEAPARSGA